MKTCIHCQNNFNPKDPRQQFCSISCSNKNRIKIRYCANCARVLTVKQKGNKYCSRSCAAHINNSKFPKQRAITKFCVECGNSVPEANHICCSILCSKKRRARIAVENGTKDRKTLRKYLIQRRGYKCENCHNTQWNEKPIPLTLEHMDGNATNNDILNLQLLCWNCHAQTPTFGSKNIGKGRKSLGLRQS